MAVEQHSLAKEPAVQPHPAGDINKPMSQKRSEQVATPTKKTKKPKSSLFKQYRAFEYFLFAALIIQTLSVPFMYRDEPHTVVLFFALLAGVHVFVKVVKGSAYYVGRFISEQFYQWGMVDHRALYSHAQMLKWQDQSWQFAIHVSMTLFEIYVLHGENWWEHKIMAWWPNPTEQYKTIKFSLKLFYLTQLAIWIYTCMMHQMEPLRNRRKDYYVMYFHHIVTIALVAGSASQGYYRIGLLVLYIHDCSDIFVDLLKLVNYTKADGPEGLFGVELSFTAAYLSWIYYRLYVYPFHVIWASFEGPFVLLEGITTWEGFFKDPIPHSIPYYWHLNILLVVLALLHVYWFYLLSKILFKIAFMSSREASRSEYEGESSCEEEEELSEHEEEPPVKPETSSDSTPRLRSRRAVRRE